MLITSDSSGESFCISVWDLHSGMQIKSYKGSSCSPHTLSLLGKQYVLAAQDGKPIIYVWNIAKVGFHVRNRLATHLKSLVTRTFRLDINSIHTDLCYDLKDGISS